MLCVWLIEIRHFTLTKELHYTIEGFWFSACGCGVDTDSTTNSVSETYVLAETEASNSRAWVAVATGDNTGGGGVLAWGWIPTCALTEQWSDLTARDRKRWLMKLCDLVWPFSRADHVIEHKLTSCQKTFVIGKTIAFDGIGSFPINYGKWSGERRKLSERSSGRISLLS